MDNTYDISRLNPKLKPRLKEIKKPLNKLSMFKQIDKPSKFKQRYISY
jgi:hypothetical protein